MKKLLLSLVVCAPIFASATTLQFNATGNNFAFNNYNSSVTGPRNVGQFGSFSLSGTGGGTFTATYLGSESGFANNYTQNLGSGVQSMGEGLVGSSLTTAVTGSGALDFGFFSQSSSGAFGAFNNGQSAGTTIGFVVLKAFSSNVAGAGFNNNTSLGAFDFLLGFNDAGRSDADYDDYVVGIKFTPNTVSEVPLPAALPLMASAIGLFGFGANRRRI